MPVSMESPTEGVSAASNGRKSHSRLWGDPSKPPRVPGTWKENIQGPPGRSQITRTDGYTPELQPSFTSQPGLNPDTSANTSAAFWSCRKSKYQKPQAWGTALFTHRFKLKKLLQYMQHKRKGFPMHKKPPKRGYIFLTSTYLNKFGRVFVDSHPYWSYILKQVNGFHTFAQKHVMK